MILSLVNEMQFRMIQISTFNNICIEPLDYAQYCNQICFTFYFIIHTLAHQTPAPSINATLFKYKFPSTIQILSRDTRDLYSNSEKILILKI